jgi:TRAP-type C4-dicarboxylate transport system permease small subunit
MLAWASWRTMDEPWVQDWSTTEDILNAAGYAFCALALFLLFAGMRLPK